jgi:hypothetical protein
VRNAFIQCAAWILTSTSSTSQQKPQLKQQMKQSIPGLQTLQLPPSSTNFTAADYGGIMDMFALFRPHATSEGRIVYTTKFGEAGLHDADKHVHTTL